MDSEPIKLSRPLSNTELGRFNKIVYFENARETNESDALIAQFMSMNAQEIVEHVRQIEMLSHRIVVRAIHFCNEVARKAAWNNDEITMHEYSQAVQELELIRRDIT